VCAEAAPGLVQAYHKFHVRGVEFVSITADDRVTCEQFVRKHAMNWPSGYGAFGEFASLKNKVPILMLIGVDGKIVWTDSSSRLFHHWEETPSELDEAIEKALSVAAKRAA
jgi:peroxiredoxin